jgi:hypothetical protein
MFEFWLRYGSAQRAAYRRCAPRERGANLSQRPSQPSSVFFSSLLFYLFFHCAGPLGCICGLYVQWCLIFKFPHLLSLLVRNTCHDSLPEFTRCGSLIRLFLVWYWAFRNWTFAGCFVKIHVSMYMLSSALTIDGFTAT